MAERLTGRYYRISPRFWQERDVRTEWSEDMRMLALYLVTSPHRNMVGLFYCPKYYMAADLQWRSDRLEVAFSRLQATRFVLYDEVAEIVFVRNALKYDAPSQGNQVAGAIRALKTLPVTPLLADLVASALKHCEPLGRRIQSEFADTLKSLQSPCADDSTVTTPAAFESLPKRVGSTVSDSVTDTDSVTATATEGVAAEGTGLADVVRVWEANGFGTIGPLAAERLVEYVESDGLSWDLVLWALEEAVSQGARKLAYVSTILQNCHAAGIRTRRDAEAAQRERRARDSPRSPAPAVTVRPLTVADKLLPGETRLPGEGES